MAYPSPPEGLKPSRSEDTSHTLRDRINDALPQTQCTRCGFPDCAAYASAIALAGADINQCPPGGAEGIERLATITGRPVLVLNTSHGVEGPRAMAVIDETWCIGCTLCLDACPTDAIFGSNKMMHTVIEPYCTGCELCIPVCPVDCISLENATGERTGWPAWSAQQAKLAQERYNLHSKRVKPVMGQGTKIQENEANDSVADRPAKPEGLSSAADQKRAVIAAALARARAARQSRG